MTPVIDCSGVDIVFLFTLNHKPVTVIQSETLLGQYRGPGFKETIPTSRTCYYASLKVSLRVCMKAHVLLHVADRVRRPIIG